MKIRIKETGEEITVQAPYIYIKRGKLYNRNTEKFEAVSGDVVIVKDKTYHVNRGYTDFQIIPCSEQEQCIVLSSYDGRTKDIIHNVTVEEIK